MRYFLVFLGLFCGVLLSLEAANVLVKDGVAQAVILLEEKPTASSQLGALELNAHIKHITGTELPILRGKAPEDGRTVIRIEKDRAQRSGEFYSLTFGDKEIVLSGNDSDDYQTVDYQDVKTFPGFEYRYNGSLFAVYDFLENQCGVRWFTMGELGTVAPVRKDLIVEGKNRQYTPQMDAFRYVNVDDPVAFTRQYSARDEALWRLRWRQTSFFGRTNHNQYSIYFAHWDKAARPGFDRAFKGKRAELFAKGYDGKNAAVDPILRSNYPEDKNIPPQLCYSNPGAVEYYADEVVTYFNGGNVIGGWHNFSATIDSATTLMPRFAGKPFFYPVQGGDTGGHCLCADCRKRFPEDNRDNVSNNKFQFVADVAKLAGQKAPGAGASTLAYIHTLKYPDRVQLPDNVSVQLCLTNYSWWHPISYKMQHDAYKEWIQKEAKKRPLTLWTYIFSTYWDAGHHFGNYKPFPGFYPWVIGKQFKEFTSDGIRGWFTEAEMRYNTLEVYVANKIAFDPSLDPDWVIDDYFTNYYGEAGKPMKEFYREVEGAFFNPANAPKEWLTDPAKVVGPKGVKHPYWGTGLNSPAINWGLCGTPARMEKLKALLADAAQKVKTPGEKARLQNFINTIWQDVLTGEAEYRLLQKRMDAPAQMLPLKTVPDAMGDPEKIDWSKAVQTVKWSSLNGEDINSSSSMQAASDGKYLYLKYQDTLQPEPERDIWRENIELFFTNGAKNPVFQLSVAPNGSISGFRYEKKNGKYEMNNYDFQPEVKNIPGEQSWEVLMAIPMNRIDFNMSEGLSANFIRTRREGTAIWNPIFCSAYLDGIDSFGKIGFQPQRIEETGFTCVEKGKASDLVADSAAHDGQSGMMKTDSGWALQCKIPFQYSPRHLYDVRVAIRGEFSNVPETQKCNIGIYDAKQRKVVGARGVQVKEIQGETYRMVHLGRYRLSPDMFLYFGGIDPKNPDNKLFCDFVELELVE